MLLGSAPIAALVCADKLRIGHEAARLFRTSRRGSYLASYGSGAAERENAARRRLDGVRRERHSGARLDKGVQRITSGTWLE
jgi:hypothetical protein